ncbi:ABC transporter substrate-binding protein [Roseomonas sp. KE0001]|uniref:ABC transporter substrate-binding protein n=1 Tax=unclassified Roseomonas TaxID=2617492 RepID=UPI0018DFB9A8|nr:ABC transporter substrate-binding protein [Roseomonas sp. KE0001]
MPNLILSRRVILGGAAALTGAALLPGRRAYAQSGVVPRKGGVLRFCRPDPPDMLDPMATNSFSGMEFSQMVYDNLVMLDADAQPLPWLATAWEGLKDGQEWLLTLREGVRFHDGQTLTSADVAATIERSIDKSRAGAGFGAFGPVQSVAAEGPTKLRVTMTMPFGEFPVVLAYRACRILPARGIDSLRETPNGTGPFRFKEFQPGSSITVEKFDGYWNPDVQHLDGVRMVFIREAVAMQAAMRGGQVDLITQIPLETYLVMRRLPGFKAHSAPTGDYHTIQIMGNKEPFTNPKVRQAFQYIPDRKAIVAAALFGQGVPGNDVTLPPGNVYLPQLPVIEQDLPRARKLLDESGVKELSIDAYTTSDRQPAPKMVLAFSEAASKIGITVRVRDIPYTEYAANVARKMPMYSSYFSGSATLYDGVYKIHHSKAIYNYGNTEVAPGLDAKLDAMIAEVDLAKRKQVAGEALKLIQAHSDRMVPYFRNYVGVTSEKVQGFEPPKYGTIETRGIWLSA